MALAPWFEPSMVPVFLHTLVVRVRRQARGHMRHRGDARAIIRACIDACWNGTPSSRVPATSTCSGRDLCFSAPSLVRLGHGERVRASLA